MRKLVLVLAVSMVALVVPGVAGAKVPVNVTACGVDVPANGTAVLQQDLTCSDTIAVTLEKGAKLNLNGHTLTFDAAADDNAVECIQTCTVYGGTLVDARTGDGSAGGQLISNFGPGSLTLHDLVMQAANVGVFAYEVNVKLTNVTATGRIAKFAASKKLTVSHSTFTDTGVVPGAPNTCLQATVVKAAVVANDVHLNSCNIWAFGNVSGDLVNITGAPDWGVSTAGKLKLTNSTITGNPVDVATAFAPHLTAVTCGTSAVADSGLGEPEPATTWHVCTEDAP